MRFRSICLNCADKARWIKILKTGLCVAMLVVSGSMAWDGTAFAALEAKQTPQRIELEFWRAIKDSTDAAEFEAYLEAYPEGKFAALAKIRAKKFANPDAQSSPSNGDATELTNTTAPDADSSQSASAPTNPDPVAALPNGVYRDCGLCPAIIDIPQGSFVAGGEQSAANAGTPVEVTLPADISIGFAEISVGQWQFCVDQGRCKENQRHAEMQPDSPAINLSWKDANDYVDWISEFTSFSYRLPTEAEWEYTARAGSNTDFWWGEESPQGHANCRDCESQWNKEFPIDPLTLKPNGFGILGSLGGVSEWVQDCWNSDTAGTAVDGSARLDGDCSQRVLRGGSWRHTKDKITASSRASYDASVRYVTNGFRVVRERGFE